MEFVFSIIHHPNFKILSLFHLPNSFNDPFIPTSCPTEV